MRNQKCGRQRPAVIPVVGNVAGGAIMASVYDVGTQRGRAQGVGAVDADAALCYTKNIDSTARWGGKC